MPNPEEEKQRHRDELAEAFVLAQLRRGCTDSQWQAVEEDLLGVDPPGLGGLGPGDAAHAVDRTRAGDAGIRKVEKRGG